MRTQISVVAGLFALLLGTPVGVSAKDPAVAEQFILSGVVSVDGGGGLAWLQEPTFTQNQVITVRQGDKVGPYRLTAIFDNGIELEGPTGKIRVPLSAPGGPASAVVSRSPEHPTPLLAAPKPAAPKPADVSSVAPSPAVSTDSPEAPRNRVRIQSGSERSNRRRVVNADGSAPATSADGTSASSDGTNADSGASPKSSGAEARRNRAAVAPPPTVQTGPKVEDIGSYLLRR